jgi:hypothetical protein
LVFILIMDLDQHLQSVENLGELVEEAIKYTLSLTARGGRTVGSIKSGMSSLFFKTIPNLITLTEDGNVYSRLAEYVYCRALNQTSEVDAPLTLKDAAEKGMEKFERLRHSQNFLPLVYSLDSLFVNGLMQGVSGVSGYVQMAQSMPLDTIRGPMETIKSRLQGYLGLDVFRQDFLEDEHYKEILPKRDTEEYEIVKSAHSNLQQIRGQIEGLLGCINSVLEGKKDAQLSATSKEYALRIQDLSHNFPARVYVGLLMTTPGGMDKASSFLEQHRENPIIKEKYQAFDQGTYFLCIK